MANLDFVPTYREALVRIRANLVAMNTRGCFNNSVDITRTSDFVGFGEGVFIGEVLEGIFDNFDDMNVMYDHRKEEIEPIKTELGKLLDILEKKVPSKNDKDKVELYEALISARCCVTHFQIQFMREKKMKMPKSDYEE